MNSINVSVISSSSSEFTNNFNSVDWWNDSWGGGKGK